MQFMVADSSVNAEDKRPLCARFQFYGIESLCLDGGVAYSIALESGVAAFTLWDRPCNLHRNLRDTHRISEV